jgi:hypothetical protein
MMIGVIFRQYRNRLRHPSELEPLSGVFTEHALMLSHLCFEPGAAMIVSCRRGWSPLEVYECNLEPLAGYSSKLAPAYL